MLPHRCSGNHQVDASFFSGYQNIPFITLGFLYRLLHKCSELLLSLCVAYEQETATSDASDCTIEHQKSQNFPGAWEACSHQQTSTVVLPDEES